MSLSVIENSLGINVTESYVTILVHRFTVEEFIDIANTLKGTRDINKKLSFIYAKTQFTGILENYRITIAGVQYEYGIDSRNLHIYDIGHFYYLKWKEICQPKLRTDFFFRYTECKTEHEKKDLIRSEIKFIKNTLTRCEIEKQKTKVGNRTSEVEHKKLKTLDDYLNPYDLEWLEGYSAERRRMIPYDIMERENLEPALRSAVAGASYYALERELKQILKHGIKPLSEVNKHIKKNKPLDETLKDIWIGSNMEYDNLMSSLAEKSPTIGKAFITHDSGVMCWNNFTGQKSYLSGLYVVLVEKKLIKDNLSSKVIAKLLSITFNIDLSDTPFKSNQRLNLDDKYKDPFINFHS